MRPDLIYSNSLVIPQGAVAALLLRKPHVWHVREILSGNGELYVPFRSDLLLRLTSFLASRLIAISESVRRQFPVSIRGRILVIYNGVELDRDGSEKASVRRLRGRQVRLALLGRLSKIKGQLDAIKAIELLREEFPDILLEIAGDGDPAYRKFLEVYIRSHDLQRNICLLGYERDPYSFLQTSDLSLVPSRMEPFGRVVIESLAAGTPVVGTDTGGIAEILRDGGGVLVPPKRPDLLAAEVRRLLRSPELMEELRSQTHEVAKRFSVQHTASLIRDEIVALMEPDMRE